MKTRSSKKLFGCLAALSSVAITGLAVAADPPARRPAPQADVIQAPSAEMAKSSPLDQKVKDIDGKDVDLAQYKGKVVMLVNVASKCGNTPQYKPLQELYTKYKDRGLVVIGFPANEFNKQEPGTEAEIKEFCSTKYAVTFPMMSKVVVKGDGIHPLYQQLTSTKPFDGDIGWNFQKFLVDRNGNVFAKVAPRTKPDDAKVVAAIEQALDAKPAK